MFKGTRLEFNNTNSKCSLDCFAQQCTLKLTSTLNILFMATSNPSPGHYTIDILLKTTLPYATPQVGKINLFNKITVTFEPIQQF